MQKTILSTLLILSIFGLKPLMACSCSGFPDFCNSLHADTYVPDLVVLGVKVDSVQHGMDLKIIEVLSGTENRDTIHVWGDPGHLCRVYTSNFNIGDTILYALHQIDSFGWGPLEQPDDYELSVCGNYHLFYHNQKVTGSITTAQDTMDYTAFKQFVVQEQCGTGIGEGQQDLAFQMYPNPWANGNLHIQWQQPLTEEIQVNILDITGKVLYSEAGINAANQPSLQVQAHGLTPGIYLVQIRSGEATATQKIIVQ